MARVKLRKLILVFAAIALYTRLFIYYLRSTDTQKDAMLSSKPIGIARKHLSGQADDNEDSMLEIGDFYSRHLGKEIVDGSSTAIGSRVNLRLGKSALITTSKRYVDEIMNKYIEQSVSKSPRSPDVVSIKTRPLARTTGATIVHKISKSKHVFLPTAHHYVTGVKRNTSEGGNNKKGMVVNQNRNIVKSGDSKAYENQGILPKGLAIKSTGTPYAKGINTVTKHATGRINVFLYKDIVPRYDNTNAHWNPLFPHFPHKSYFMTKLGDDGWIPATQTRRFLGYLHIGKSGLYSFKVDTRMGIDLLIFERVISNETIIFRFGISEDDMHKQKISWSELYQAQSKEVWLDKGKAYPIDLIHGGLFYAQFSLKIKCKADSRYEIIDAKYLSPLYENSSLNVALPESYAYTKGIPELRKRFNADRRLMFSSRIQINSKSCKTGLEMCPYSPSYLFRGSKVKLYYGQGHVQKDRIYPYDHTNYHEEAKNDRKFLNASIAKGIAARVFNSINQMNGRVYKLQSIVHVEENSEKRRYFVELDLQNINDGRSYRFSDYVLKTTHSSDQLCLPKGYSNQWRHNVTIYLVCAVKNQRQWFQYLIQSTEQLIKRTNEQNLHLIVVDFHSSDADLKAYLQDSKLNYTLLQMEGNFSKVKALNEGVRHIPSNDSIVFVMDLQLKIPDHIFDQARKHTIEGTTAYCPILIRLAGSENPEFTEVTEYSIWQDIGYGMVSIFKSDWDRIGGMNEKMFGEKWGGEDWEFVDRIIVGRLELIHQRLPGFYHIYHSTLGTWDGRKLS